MKKIFTFMLTLVLSLGAILGLTACGGGDDYKNDENDGGEQTVVYTVTQEVWEQNLQIKDDCNNAKILFEINLDDIYAYQFGEIDGDKIRSGGERFDGGAMTSYEEKIYEKQSEGNGPTLREYYNIYSRNNKEGLFEFSRENTVFVEFRMETFYEYLNLAKALKDKYSDCLFDSKNNCYNLSLESFAINENTTVTNINYNIYFQNNLLKVIKGSLTDDENDYSFEISFNVAISVPTENMVVS